MEPSFRRPERLQLELSSGILAASTCSQLGGGLGIVGMQRKQRLWPVSKVFVLLRNGQI
jgi:hypothetical protein